MEELETSKEELQSMNEELQTVNQENRHKVEELALLSGDLQNLLAATDIATLFLDRNLRILRFTPKVGELFSVRPVDRGRPLADITHRLGYDALLADAEATLRTLVPVEREVQDEGGQWYLTRVFPYRSIEDRIEGVVLTFVDITARKQAEEEVRASKVYAESIVETLHEPLLVLHPDLRVKSANQAFYDHFEVDPAATEGVLVYELGNGQWNIPELRTLLEDVLPDSNVFTDFEVRHDFEDLGERVMLVNARRLDHVQLILLGIRDITERKRAEDALRESEERLQRMLNVSGVGVLTFRADGTLVGANETFLHMHGYTREEVEAGTLTWRALTPEEYVAESERQLARMAETGRVGPYEKEYFRKDGSRSWLLFAGAALPDGTIVEYCIDVGDRKRVEQQLRESEERYRLLVESAREYAILLLDPEGTITTWSRGAERVFGYTEAEALGQPFATLFTEEDRAAGVPERELEAAAEQGRASDDRWHVRNDGTRFWASGVTEALHDADGSLRGFSKVLRDNTARKATEDALSESEERFRAVADLVPDLLWRAGPSGERTWGNRRWMEYAGQTLEEAVGLGWADAVHPDDRDRALEAYRAALTAGEPFRHEYRLRRADGAYRWFLAHAAPVLGDDGHVVEWFGADSDVHEQRVARETLEARVEERTAQVRELARALALAEQAERRRIALLLHDDLQQRLYGLSITLNLLRRASGAEAAGFLDHAEQTLDGATELTRTLSHEMAPPLLQGDDFADLLEWVADLKRVRLGLDVEVEVRGAVSVPEEGVRVLLYGVLQELLFNVAKHAGTDRARVVAEREGPVVRVVVEDEGAGFDVAEVERGDGLGLPSVRERLELVGGRMEVTSAPGAGTRVTLTVPHGGRSEETA